MNPKRNRTNETNPGKLVSDSDALRHLEQFHVREVPLRLAYLGARADDYYLALVGELFERMRSGYGDANQWARLGNAFVQFATIRQEHELREIGVELSEARLFGAAAFYLGGFPASAYLTLNEQSFPTETENYLACFDLLARPTSFGSSTVQSLVEALLAGNLAAIATIEARAAENAANALQLGPDAWIPQRLLHRLIVRFAATNVRAVLPDGASNFWTPLVSSLLKQAPPVWDFFPSQIEAIRSGLLQRRDTFSLQMPTGAGKTAICETLIYEHLKQNPTEAAVLLVPYRSLASELRATLVSRLNAMGISATCAYGGTVPTGDEIRTLSDTRALVATPETLSGLLTADSDFFRRISLLVCDEGHLLDGGARGVGLELLLSRMKVRNSGPPRFIFLSAIVPNIEEINLWLGGTRDSVVRSDYRPALAEFGVLRTSGTGASDPIALELHPHEALPIRYSIEGFLQRTDFQYTNPINGRRKTFAFTSVKTRAIAAARKALEMGAVAVFAANKRGTQGAIGLADELLNQLQQTLQLPAPIAFANSALVETTAEYLQLEYGANWVGARALAAGAVLHHGDIPQETREVVETLLRKGAVRFAICTNTLAEGVNLPIRTLVLYSVQRRTKDGHTKPLLARDIKNLIGRTGRPGATTKGLVICANAEQWPIIEPVARQVVVEPVIGALRSLVGNLRRWLAGKNLTLTNTILEKQPALYTLIEGIDATLIDLAVEEIGEDQLIGLAVQLASQTFASLQADAESKSLMNDVFELRARRVLEIRSAGRLGWMRETGTRARMLDTVENGLLPMRDAWNNVVDPTDAGFVNVVLEWAWTQRDLQSAIRKAYRIEDNVNTNSVRLSFFESVSLWLSGSTFEEMASRSTLDIDDILAMHSQVVAYTLQTLVEQAIALLSKLLESRELIIAPAVVKFPEHLRFGVPTSAACVLANGAVRHRRAAVALENTDELRASPLDDRLSICLRAQRILVRDHEAWQAHLGRLILENTLQDLSAITG